MGLIYSRLNLEVFHPGRRRSQQDGTIFLFTNDSYSLNKNYFSNYFLMGGERFEVNDPDYLFGDFCDLNFLSCTKPYSLPYKQAQQNLLSNLNTKQKAINKVSSRANRFSSPFNILTGRRRRTLTGTFTSTTITNTNADSRKQDAQTQTLQSSKSLSNCLEPSQPLVMFVNIRKETLRLVKSFNQNLDSDLNSNNSVSISNAAVSGSQHTTPLMKSEQLRQKDSTATTFSTKPVARSLSKHSKVSTKTLKQQTSSSRHSAESSRATTSTIHSNEPTENSPDEDSIKMDNLKKFESDISSLLSATSSIRSGYTSVKGEVPDCPENNDLNVEVDDDDDDEDFEDALNDTTNLSIKDDDDDDSEQTQQEKSLLGKTTATKENRDIKITIEPLDDTSARNSSDTKTDQTLESSEGDENLTEYSTPKSRRASSRRLTKSLTTAIDNNSITTNDNFTNQQQEFSREQNIGSPSKNPPCKVYNIEFYFDADVDCSIRIFYFCTREITSNGISYKPQHATYKSKVYHYKKGLNQKFDQQEHTFQPYLFDEDLLIYKPLDLDGKYNSGAVFPIVIHCVALEGPEPRQSHSLIATIEKSQLDDSYSIKPLKQLIFVDGVQYILQDIYGIEHKQLLSSTSTNSPRNKAPKLLKVTKNNLRVKSQSVQSNLDAASSLNLSDSASVASVDCSESISSRQNRGSLISNQHKSLGSENTFECVICMSEERDTMLLPCRHLCLCSSCAQSLRYQANSCPICRCPFKAALNFRPIRRHSQYQHSTKKSITASSSPVVSTGLSSC